MIGGSEKDLQRIIWPEIVVTGPRLTVRILLRIFDLESAILERHRFFR